MTNTVKLFQPFVSPKAAELVREVLESGQLAQGQMVDYFEQELRDWFGWPHVCTVNSCTSALHLAFHLLKTEHNLLDDTEVICSPLTCAAGIQPIVHNRMKVKFVDISTDLCITDPTPHFTEKTRILSFVHWGGEVIPYYIINRWKSDYTRKFGKELYVVEDCAHAFGSYQSYINPTSKKDAHIGTVLSPGTISCFSFQAIKNLTTGDGGCLLLPTKELNERARKLRWFGIDRDRGGSFRGGSPIEECGFKFHMNDVAAAIGLANIAEVRKALDTQKLNASIYNEKLPKEILPHRNECDPSYWLYTIKVKNANLVQQKLAEKGVEANPVHLRNDRLACFKEAIRTPTPYLDSLDNGYLCIPVGPHVENPYEIAEIVKECL